MKHRDGGKMVRERAFSMYQILLCLIDASGASRAEFGLESTCGGRDKQPICLEEEA